MRPTPRRIFVAVAFIAVFSSAIAAQQTALKSITYRLSMSRPMSHLFDLAILIVLPDQLKDKPLQLQMARWSPGRYGVFDFAKNVQEVRAAAEGTARPVSRINDQT